jgi:hypothetical protein
MNRSQKMILYYCAGSVPTEKERAEAAAIGASSFRNAAVAAGEGPERCDGICGNFPPEWLEAAGLPIMDAKPKSKKSVSG